ncbi:MAG TPA: hypothetical protein VHO48_01435 [Anaerolineaceae bacterium]|nr:hypothetical protein [Anaerolineaceae bacterium]
MKSTLWIPAILLISLLLSACQAAPVAMNAPEAGNLPALTSAPDAIDPSPTPRPSIPTLAPTSRPLPTENSDTLSATEAEQAARAYFAAVAEGKTEEAADQISSFSLMVFQLTRGEAAADLQAEKIKGTRWSDLEVLDTQPFDSQTILVHVAYSETIKKEPAQETASPTPTLTPASAQSEPANKVEALWPMRLESGAWRYNWKNLIDFRTLDGLAQTMNGITLMPVQMNRFSDKIQLVMLVQNRTNEAVVFGQVNENLGTFHFGDDAVIAEKTQWILNPLRSVPDATLEINGLFQDWPDMVEIRKWTNYNVEPWYVFQLK